MRKMFVFLILLFFLVNFVSSSSYKEVNRQIGREVYFEVFKNNESIDKGFFELINSKEGFFFLKKIKFNESYDSAEILVVLDYGYFLSELGATPQNYEIFSDGHLIKLKWYFENIKEGEEKIFFVVIENPHQKSDSFYIYIVSVVILISVFFLTLLFFLKKRKKENEKFLLDEERKIINYLKKCNRNEAWQKNIQKELGFSKAKLSRLIRNLESRNLIKKIPFGNTNKIVIK